MIIGVYGSQRRIRRLFPSLREYLVFTFSLESLDHSLTVVPCIWVPQARDPSEGVVDVWGNRKLFAFGNSGCISNPSIRIAVRKKLEIIASKGFSTIVLDAARYPSPIDGGTFLSCFCSHCISINPSLRRIKELLIYSIRKRDSRMFAEALLDLALARVELLIDFLGAVSDWAKELGLELWAAVFPEPLSILVGQDYRAISRFYRLIQPMCYHSCATAACFWAELKALRNLVESLGLDPRYLEVMDPALTRFLSYLKLSEDPVTALDIVLHVAKSSCLDSGCRCVPIMWLDDTLAKNLLRIALDQVILFAPERTLADDDYNTSTAHRFTGEQL